MDTKAEKKRLHAANKESFIDLIIEDDAGRNLLDVDFNYAEKIELIYYDNEGMESVYFNANLTAKRGYLIDKYDNSIRLFLNTPYEGENSSETYFRFNKGEIDVFTTEFDISYVGQLPDRSYVTSIVRKRIWLNKRLIWEADALGDKKLEAVKVIKNI